MSPRRRVAHLLRPRMRAPSSRPNLRRAEVRPSPPQTGLYDEQRKGGTLRCRPSFSSIPCREWKPVLHARTRTVSDLHATALVVADAVGGRSDPTGDLKSTS